MDLRHHWLRSSPCCQRPCPAGSRRGRGSACSRPRALVDQAAALVEVADEHDIGAHGVGAVLIHDVVGIDHVAAGLGHLLAALAKDHAVAGALVIGLRIGHHTDVIEEVVPETAVQQMQGGVLHAAVVPVHLTPVIQRLLAGQRIGVVQDPYSAGSTRRNRPTEAWCRSHARRGRRSRGRWSPPKRVMALSGDSPSSVVS